MDKKSQYRGCMLGLAIGDSLGYPTEFIRTRENILAATDGFGVTDLPNPAIYTDDTQMTICIAEALLENGRELDPFMKTLSKKFIEWLKTQDNPAKRRAPGNTCIQACVRLLGGMDWEHSGIPQSQGCGSAMRSAPIGLYHNQSEVIADFAINSSRITHPHELAMCGSVTNAMVTRYALDGVPTGMWANDILKIASISYEFTELIQLAAEEAALKTHDPDYVLSSECLGEGWTGHEAVASALYCCMMHPNSYKDAVLLAANAVGDSDSIACITGGWMGAKFGTDGIPARWMDLIEDRDILIGLADRLLTESAKPEG